jgi:protein O-mannosyl-transferase
VTFPFLLLLWDYWPLRRMGSSDLAVESAQRGSEAKTSIGWLRVHLVLEKLPWLALAAASSFLTMQAQRAAGSVKGLSLYSLPLRIETSLIAYVRYLGKAFWPTNLVALYPHPTKLYPVWQIVASAALLVLVTVLAVAARGRRYLAVGWLWFLGSLVPMIGVIQVGAQAMADRYAYIPFVGLFVMIVWLVADWSEARKLSSQWLAVPAAACLITLGALTYHQVFYWHDTESFWHRTIDLTEDNYVAHDILGYYLTTQGRAEEGAAQFRDALAIRPEDPEANLSLGPYEEAHGHFAAAVEHYQNVALYSARPAMRATALFNLGHAYRKMGDLPRAKQYFEMTLQMSPNEAMAMVGLGLIADANGDSAEAVRQFSSAQAVKPDDVTALLLAHALERAGREQEASIVQERVQSSPNFAEAQKIAALLLAGN